MVLAGVTAAVLGIVLMTQVSLPRASGRAADRPAPEFPTSDPALWIQSPPLSMAGLRGRVVVIDVWTFG
jgi:hypothetical protein